MPVAEKQGLLSVEGGSASETVKVIGTEFKKNGYPWHFAIMFKLPTEDSEKKAFDEVMQKPADVWKKCFSRVNNTGKFPSSIQEGVTTKKQFHEAVFKEVVNILGGDRNGLELGTMPSIDNDEQILMVALIDPKAKVDLADAEELTVRLREDVYKKVSAQLPTDIKVYQGEEGTFTAEPSKEFNGDPIPNTHPAYLNFSTKRSEKFEEIGQLDCIRLVRRRLVKFINMNELVDQGITTKWFPVHHWDELAVLNTRGWNDPIRFFQWPSEGRCDAVNDYFGPEMGFFFHWFNFLTRWLCFPAVVSIGTYGLRKSGLVDRAIVNYVSMGFAVMLLVWSSMFVSNYRQAKNLKQNKWGMETLGVSSLTIRKQFKDVYRDSCADYLQHIVHWAAVVFFVFETIYVVYWCSQIQMHAREHPKGTTFGISNEYVATYPKYLITVNIKLVDKVWGPVSNMLTRSENWRSVQELQQQMIAKMFVVKMFVFYYPFFYIILVKPFTKGCGPHDSHTDLTGCVDELNESLILFFFSQVAIEIALIVAYLGLAAWSVRSEKKNHPDKEYTYLELQAKTMPYNEEDLIADMLNAVVTYGYIILFGVSLPFMCLLGLLSNLCMLRLLAYKVSYAYQRPMPKAMDGIGAWETVIRVLGYLGVIANAYIAIFTLKAFREKTIVWKLLTFIILQNVGFAVKMAIEQLYDDKNSAHKRIIEYNVDCLDQLLDEEDPPRIRSAKVSTVESPYQ